MFYFLFFLHQTQGTIVFFQNSIVIVDTSINCANGYQNTRTISFGDTFDYIPQVFNFLVRMEYSLSAEFQISVESVTKTNLVLKYACPTGRIRFIQINTCAFTDQRLQVFSNYNMQNPSDVVFTKKDSNAVNGFLNILSIGQVGPIDFSLQIIDLSPYEFKVAIVQDSAKAANLKQIGYVVIVGSEEALRIYQKYIWSSTNTSPVHIKLPYQQYLLSIQGINYQYTDNMIIGFQYYTPGGNEQYGMSGTFTPNINQACHFKYDGYTTQATEYSCFTLRISRKELIDVNQPLMILEIIDMNKSFSALGSFIQDLIIINPVQFSFQCKCIKGKKIKAVFNKCSTCIGANQSYIQNQICYNSKQLVSFFPKYNANTQFKGNLKIQIEIQKITLTQLIYNHRETQIVIAVVEYIDQ